MNENYLWDKNGADAEIEQLENALKTFRYQETPSPRIMAEIAIVKPRNRFSFFRLGFAFATTCAVLAIIGVSIWNYVADKNSNVIAIDSAKTVTPNPAPVVSPTTPENPNVLTVGSTQTAPVKPTKIIQRSSQQKFTKTRKVFPAVNARNEKPNSEIAPTETVAQLSGEEKYAYDQLMLALSITSSKLKIVREKLGVMENPPPVSNGGK